MTTRRLFSKITIFEALNGRDLILDLVHKVELSKTWETLTDMGTIVLPGRLKRGDRTITVGSSGILKVGQKIKIELGYYPTLNTEFEGYISEIEPKSPAIIHVEDSMFLLKQNNITASYASVNVRTLIPDLLSKAGITGIQTNLIDANIGTLRVSNANIAEVLEELRKNYGLYSYFRGNVLTVGLAYPNTPTKREYGFQVNIILDNIDNQDETDIKINLKGVSVQEDNTKIEYESGDKGGDQKTLYYYNISFSELKKIIDNEVTKYRYTGYFGEFKTFGDPFADHGDVAVLQDLRFPERDGEYFIDKVNTSFGVGIGYKRDLKLGLKAG